MIKKQWNIFFLRIVLLVTFLLVGLLAPWLLLFLTDCDSYPIELSEIPEVLNRKDLPALPNWSIKYMEKYDTVFTSPSVIIYYNNGVSLTLYQRIPIYRKMQKEQILIGDRYVSSYKNGEEQIYVVKYNGLFFSFNFQPENKNEVEEFIKTLK